MCILIVDHQFNCMHPGVPGNACFQEGAVLAKHVTPFGIGVSCCYPIFWVKVNCVPKTTLCELYGVKVWEGLA